MMEVLVFSTTNLRDPKKNLLDRKDEPRFPSATKLMVLNLPSPMRKNI